MTNRQPDEARDWDAEFEAIAKSLRPQSDSSGDEPHEMPPASRHRFDHGFTEPPKDNSRGDSASSSATDDDSPVPGFRDQWRMRDDAPSLPNLNTNRPLEDPPELEDDDDFVPPEPTPLDSDDPATIVMLGCLVLGPLWLLYLLFFDRNAATLWWSLAALITAAGFVMAVARQPKSRDEDDDDDGARV